MKPEEFLKDVQGKIGDLLSQSPAKDVERNVKALLAQGFSKLDIVSREDFDIQSQVLARTRQRLEELERRVAQLEQGIGQPTAAAPRSASDAE
jgi:BMFP domain-containing protein YqiC